MVADDDDLGAGGTIPRPSGSRRRGRIWRIVLLRFAAYVPLALALAYGSLRLVQATYRELTLPSDVVTPIAWRVISTVPEAVIAILVTWALGETLGSLGARRIVLWGQSLDHAYFGAWADLLRRPLSTFATFALPTVVMALLVAPIILASGVAWEYLRTELARRPERMPRSCSCRCWRSSRSGRRACSSPASRPPGGARRGPWSRFECGGRSGHYDMARRGSGSDRKRPAALNAPPDRGRHEVVMVIESRACPSCADSISARAPVLPALRGGPCLGRKPRRSRRDRGVACPGEATDAGKALGVGCNTQSGRDGRRVGRRGQRFRTGGPDRADVSRTGPGRPGRAQRMAAGRRSGDGAAARSRRTAVAGPGRCSGDASARTRRAAVAGPGRCSGDASAGRTRRAAVAGPSRRAGDGRGGRRLGRRA